MSQAQVDNFLEHYGVPGMHWGVRRGSSGSGGSFSRRKKVTVPEVQTVGKGNSLSAKPANKKMTDSQLRERINRLQMEKQYSQLMAERNPQKTNAAKKMVAEIMQTTLKQSATQILTAVAINAGKQFVASQVRKSNPDLSKSLWNPKSAEDAKKIIEDLSKSNKTN